MNSPDQVAESPQERRRHLLRTGGFILLVCAFIVGGALIIAYEVVIPSSSKVALKVGEVASEDILAPRSLQYQSDVLTQAKRDAEIAAVRPIYDPPDPAVEAEQTQLARQILDYIENIRYDDYATLEQKEDLAAITELDLSDSVAEAILTIEDDSKWRAIDTQIMRLLERVMTGEIREDNIQAIKDSLPNFVSATYSEIEVRIIQDIVSDLIRFNAFFNEELTHQAQLQASENVPPEMRSFVRGQMIIREGEIATAAHIESLDRFDLLKITQRRTEQFVGGLIVMGLITALVWTYLRRFHPDIIQEPPFFILLGVLFLTFLAGAQFVSADAPAQPYYYPAAALAFLVATLFGAQLAILMVVVVAALAGYMTNNSLEFMVLVSFSGTLGVLSLGRTERLNAYFVAGGVVGLTGACIAMVFALSGGGSDDLFTVFLKVIASLANGVFSAAVTLVGLYAITNILNIPTSLKIAELMQPNHPLLQRLLREAPGTYQHSLQVANLSELGAQQVGANASLLRVAAMYHDVGKILNPHFFVENQVDGVNPHDTLNDAHQSARIILGHVTEGDRLARRYHLPTRIRDFIMEHHGTTQVVFFYRQALQEAESNGEVVEQADFTYPGPPPQSRETAILMLADGCESSVRARRPQSKQDIQETVDYIFESRLQSRQLDDSGLTLSDLRLLRDSFLTALQGIFHPRIAYPGSPGQSALPTGGTSKTEEIPLKQAVFLPQVSGGEDNVVAGDNQKASD